MKKVLAIVAIMLGLGFGARAQSDRFFTQTYSEYRGEEDVFTPSLPYAHNLGEHQPAAYDDVPLGSGLLLLAGMGLTYIIRKKS